jgi:hypothetical protein
VEFFSQKFDQIRFNPNKGSKVDWVMGQLHHAATGNFNLKELKAEVEKLVK